MLKISILCVGVLTIKIKVGNLNCISNFIFFFDIRYITLYNESSEKQIDIVRVNFVIYLF